jgi:hypothetical protein
LLTFIIQFLRNIYDKKELDGLEGKGKHFRIMTHRKHYMSTEILKWQVLKTGNRRLYFSEFYNVTQITAPKEVAIRANRVLLKCRLTLNVLKGVML